MKNLTNYIAEEQVNEGALNIFQNVMQLLSMFAGVTMISFSDFKTCMSGGIVVIITLIWTMKSHNIPFFDEEDVNEALGDDSSMLKLVKKLIDSLMKNSKIAGVIKGIMNDDRYKEIEKTQDKEQLIKLVNDYGKENKEAMETANKELENTKL